MDVRMLKPVEPFAIFVFDQFTMIDSESSAAIAADDPTVLAAFFSGLDPIRRKNFLGYLIGNRLLPALSALKDHPDLDLFVDDNFLLKVAIVNGSYASAQFLLDAGADVTSDYNYPIRAAVCVEGCEPNMIKLLLHRGADVKADMDYALRYSCATGNVVIAAILLEAGANVHADSDYGIVLAVNSRSGPSILELLLTYKINIHVEDELALRLAVANGDSDNVSVLLRHGADVKKIDEYCKVRAVISSDVDTVKLLMTAGCDFKSLNSYPSAVPENMTRLLAEFEGDLSNVPRGRPRSDSVPVMVDLLDGQGVEKKAIALLTAFMATERSD